MTRPALRRLLRLALETDALAVQDADGWSTRCLHCRSALRFTTEGEPLNGATLEHAVPRSWFEKRAAAAITMGLEGADDPRNLALACARCNQQKGKGPDAQGPGDPRALEIVARLAEARRARWITR